MTRGDIVMQRKRSGQTHVLRLQVCHAMQAEVSYILCDGVDLEREEKFFAR